MASGRVAHGVRGAVAAGHPLAAVAGLRMLEAGGTAVDACVAMAAMAWVVMPDMCGPGGDLFALWREPGGGVHAVNGAGIAPAAFAMPDDPEDRAGLTLIPGAPAAVQALAKTACRLDLAALFAPAVAAAAAGFMVGPRFERNLHSLPAGAFRAALADMHGGSLPAAGERFALPALGANLARWAAACAPDDVLAQAVAEWRLQRVTVTAEEALVLRVRAEAPLALRLGGWQIFAQPPISQAVATLAALAVAGLEVVRHADGAYRTHMLIEAFKAAYADLVRWGEGADVAAATASMLDSERVRAARERIGPMASAGAPMNRNYGETTQCAAADSEGRVCTLIHSLYRPFGARVLAPSTGFIANDRGATFTDGANAPKPGRRPRNTLVNLLAVQADGAAVAFGTPGAQAQTQTNLQVLADLIRDPSDIWTAIERPRWSFIGEDRVAVEASLAPDCFKALEQMGHKLALRPAIDWLMGSVSLAASSKGRATAVADHRREAIALAF